MKLSHLNALRALEATLRNGTFTAAAAELGVTVAAIGQQIRGLEEFLGVKLFERLPQGVRPTAVALAVAARLTEGFGQIEEVLGELRPAAGTDRLKVTMSHFMLDDWLAQRMPAFHQRYPRIEVSYEISVALVDLAKGDIDMAIRFSREAGHDFAAENLHGSAYFPVCTPAVAERFGLSPRTRDLTGVPLFQLYEVTTDPEWIGWSAIIDRHGLRCDSPGPLQQTGGFRVAIGGSGLVICGLTECYNDLLSGNLVAPLGPEYVIQSSYRYRLVWPARRSLNRPMRAFRDWIVAESRRFAAEVPAVLGVPLA
ncbi:LysR substrate-binding domain-containing protein [Limimaricola sp.]|uniref:LysR substrate-binding domain-containing protein n=1 Tax=Limimaricola sp. TaxID=2211665 RepID=UPI0025BB87C6|nr:LysR substrate-binding domain-containing protein [Limimaricola sp.]